MTLLDMQRVFSRILTDPEFHRSFAADDPSACAGYQLTDRELSSLRGLREARWDWVRLHSHLLAHGRLEMGLKALPLTQLVLGERVHAELDRFCREFPPVPEADSTVVVEARRLCRFVARLAEEGALEPAWAVEVAEYERICVVLGGSPQAADSAAAVARRNTEVTGPAAEHPELVPVTGAHTHLAAFRYPLVELLPVLERGEVPADLAPADQPLLILFCKVPGVHQVQTSKVNRKTAALVRSCDGRRTVREVLDGAAGGDPRVAAGAATVIDQLRAAGVLGLRTGPRQGDARRRDDVGRGDVACAV